MRVLSFRRAAAAPAILGPVTEFLATTLALLAVALQAIVVGFVLVVALAPVWAPARRARDGVRALLSGAELALAWIVAVVATLASLYFSEVADFIPCQLCWYQRIAMYPLAVILFLAALARDVRGAYYAVALPVVGAAVAVYHIYVEYNPEQESPCCRIGAPCSTKWIEELGYVTLPVLALTAFATIAVLLLLRLRPLARTD
jgi:disulfide bond formation protein DsbB